MVNNKSKVKIAEELTRKVKSLRNIIIIIIALMYAITAVEVAALGLRNGTGLDGMPAFYLLNGAVFGICVYAFGVIYDNKRALSIVLKGYGALAGVASIALCFVKIFK